MKRVVIIGAGPAGITVAETLRGLDPEVRLTVVSAEPYPPYSPPALADHFLTGRDEPLFWKGRDVCDRLGVDFRSGVRVAEVEPDRQRLALDDGGVLYFDALVIASGSRLHAPVEGSERRGVHDFKSLRTATALVERVRRGEARSALIVGAGFIGTEIALLLVDLGAKVTMVERLGWVMPRMLDRETAEIAVAAMRARGIDVRLGIAVEAFVGEPEVTGVQLAGGEVLAADLCIAATGVKPNVDFLIGTGVDVGWGIRVDDHLRTSVTGIWAAGDAVEAPDRLTGEPYVHAIFPNAIEQGRVVGLNLAGQDVAYDGAERMNSLKHLGLPIVAVGAETGEVELRWRHDTALRKVFLDDGRIVGFRLAGDISVAGVLRSLMLRRVDVRRFAGRLVDPRFGEADLIARALPA